MAQQSSSSLPTAAPPILLAEILSFSPQLFLDDIIDSATDAIDKCMTAMETFLDRWAEDREAKRGTDGWDRTKEVEQGLVAFQTLLEYHTDVAFDFLELWCKRNIFALAADLPVIAPHQAGLNLRNMEESPQQETELLMEVEELRRKVDNQRRLHRLYTRAARIAAQQHARSQRRLETLSFLDPSTRPSPSSPSITTASPPSSQTKSTTPLTTVPPRLLTLFASLRSLPELEDAPLLPSHNGGGGGTKSGGGGGLGIGKREWEMGKEGYLSWAVGELVGRAKAEARAELERKGVSGASGAGDTAVQDAKAIAEAVGTTKDLKGFLAADGRTTTGVSSRNSGAPSMEEDMDVDT